MTGRGRAPKRLIACASSRCSRTPTSGADWAPSSSRVRRDSRARLPTSRSHRRRRCSARTSRSESVLLAVPAGYSREQLALLLGVINETGVRGRGPRRRGARCVQPRTRAGALAASGPGAAPGDSHRAGVFGRRSPGTQAQPLRDRVAQRRARHPANADAVHRRNFHPQDALRSAARRQHRAATGRSACPRGSASCASRSRSPSACNSAIARWRSKSSARS